MKRSNAESEAASGCGYCRSPLSGSGVVGRPWPDRSPATYCCYGCLSLGEHRLHRGSADSTDRSSLGGLGFRLGIALVVAGQSTMFGLALNLHDDVPTNARWAAQSLILCSTLLVVAMLGAPLLRAAWAEVRRGRITIEALFLLTLSGALAASVQAHLTGRGKVYFEVVSILLVVYTVGKLVGSRSRARAVSASQFWSGQPTTCRKKDESGAVRSILVSEIVPGDAVEVHAGETIPVDGTIREGVGFVSEAPVSGEPFAVVRRPGDRVLAGTISFDATFRIESASRGTQRQVDRLLAAIEIARNAPLALQSHADRLAKWFLPLVVVAALGTFAYWSAFAQGGWEAGLFNAMSVLLVSCPCAIGLATPLTIWSALGRLAERGLIVRGGDTIERLAEVDSAFLDKTGTLTDDGFHIRAIATQAIGADRARILGWMSLIESHSHHPIAKPFADLPREFGSEEPHVASATSVPGCGVEGALRLANGTLHRIRMGRPDWIVPGSGRAVGSHRIDVEIDGELAASAVVVERVRSTAREALEQFQALGLPIEVLSGDRSESAVRLGELPVHLGLLPEEKRLRVEAAKRSGWKPLMVGDGINDASALAAAHVGIALASGTDLAVAAADATLYGGDLRVLPWAVAVSRDAVRTVRHNLLRAAIYNLIGITLAAMGLLHPIAAVLLMMASSLWLIASSTRFRDPTIHRSNVLPLPSDRSMRVRSAVHFAAIALQPFVLIALVESARPAAVALPLIVAFAMIGIASTWVWHRWSGIPHALDMCFGMISLGNLGMLLGWWMDNGFGPLRDAGCRECIAAARSGTAAPGMWIGMVLFANLAMFGLGRNDWPRGHHALAMFTGGNLGMLLGMIGGGWCAAQVESVSSLAAVLTSVAGMTAGMLSGMLLGTWMAAPRTPSADTGSRLEHFQFHCDVLVSPTRKRG